MSERDIDAERIRGRLPYSPIVDRPSSQLPGGARVAVWTIVNVENWRPTAPMPRAVLPPPMGQPLLPDIPNWAWHEYGMRVGFWRFVEVLGSRGLKASFAVNGSACDVYEPACRAAHEAGWDFIGHGFVQRPMHRVEDQAAAIRQTIDAIRQSDRLGAARLGKPGPDGNDGNARPPGRSRHRICLRLVSGRSAGDADDLGRPDRLGALHGRNQRRGDDRRPGPSLRRNLSGAASTSSTASTSMAPPSRA